ncbi:twin-arginine translocase TatA/TatE family subunit [Mucilaginibacter segetis]|uniref:Sec-independent protein translocase protein TatA n=1 Tax=Mucilaginibacter segetis TaxID=2793071 RepID=A0A934PY03_9SPHI|nr:twin-arginine translocase TatA/TatE family subunit [Mucilaginibacter segetis]MBK0381215.1 twin-arginine translocase TatA/TatE family subunit [Mucilaginibacter segetis]
MGGLGAPEIILIIIAILILFGGRKIPELMKGLGKGMKEFKDAQNGESNNTTNTSATEEKPKA